MYRYLGVICSANDTHVPLVAPGELHEMQASHFLQERRRSNEDGISGSDSCSKARKKLFITSPTNLQQYNAKSMTFSFKDTL